MEPVKVVIFIIAFVLLLVLGRLLSSRAEVHASQLPIPDPQDHSPKSNIYVMGAAASAKPLENSSEAVTETGQSNRKQALTGAEIPFPFAAPPVRLEETGRFNRPYFLNYYFREIDLVDGPPDRTSFCDHLTVVYQYPESTNIWESEYLVATPAGLRDYMTRLSFESLYLDHYAIIVREWNLATIMRTLLDEQMRSMALRADDEQKGPMPVV